MRILCSCLQVFLLVAIVAFPSRAWADGNMLPIVFENYPPYEYVEDGEVKGINMDLIREAFRRMGVQPFFEPRPWKRAMLELERGDILALSSGFRTPERELFALFSEPLAMETNVVAALTVSGVEVNSLEDLRDLRVGVVSEYVYGGGVEDMRGLDKIETKSSQQLVVMLLNQRVDVAIGNKAVFRHVARQLGQLPHIRFAHEIGSEPLRLMFSREHGEVAEEYLRDFNKALSAMRKDGTFDAIVGKY